MRSSHAVRPVRSKLSRAVPGGVGLTTALEVLPGGWVVVGSIPSENGSAATAKAGCLVVLNRRGRVAETLSGHGINGPWDATGRSRKRHGPVRHQRAERRRRCTASVVHQGTVLRLTLLLRRGHAPLWVSATKVASGLAERRTRPRSCSVPPASGSAATAGCNRQHSDQRDHRGPARADPARQRRSRHPGHKGKLNKPLGLAIAPNGDILTVNGDNGKIVETTPGGAQIASRLLDTRAAPWSRRAVRPGRQAGRSRRLLRGRRRTRSACCTEGQLANRRVRARSEP